jgi:hypothetical protein
MKQRYDVHPNLSMIRDWIDTLKAKSGRTVEEWVDLVSKEGPHTTAERKAWLKATHGLGTNGASWIIDRAEGRDEGEEDPATYLRLSEENVETMFSGPKAALRPLYDALYDQARSLGSDVLICPAKTIVAIYRRHVIAQIKPSTRTRIDFGLALKNTPVTGRLIDTGGLAKKDRITHRLEVTKPADIDAELKRWLVKAYQMDA